MANNISPESTPKERREKIDELQRVINPDEEGGSIISGMCKRVGFSDGNQVPVQGLDKDYRRKARL